MRRPFHSHNNQAYLSSQSTVLNPSEDDTPGVNAHICAIFSDIDLGVNKSMHWNLLDYTHSTISPNGALRYDPPVASCAEDKVQDPCVSYQNWSSTEKRPAGSQLRCGGVYERVDASEDHQRSIWIIFP